MNPSQLITDTFQAHVEDERRQAEAARRAGKVRSRRGLSRRARARPAEYAEHVVIRTADAWDDAALVQLAQLDSSPLPKGEKLVAEVGGELIAALGLADGRAVADPFKPTADVVGLLRMRAGQLAGSAAGRNGRRRAFALAPRRSATGSVS